MKDKIIIIFVIYLFYYFFIKENNVIDYFGEKIEVLDDTYTDIINNVVDLFYRSKDIQQKKELINNVLGSIVTYNEFVEIRKNFKFSNVNNINYLMRYLPELRGYILDEKKINDVAFQNALVIKLIKEINSITGHTHRNIIEYIRYYA